jgi:hypothetical protein
MSIRNCNNTFSSSGINLILFFSNSWMTLSWKLALYLAVYVITPCYWQILFMVYGFTADRNLLSYLCVTVVQQEPTAIMILTHDAGIQTSMSCVCFHVSDTQHDSGINRKLLVFASIAISTFD